MSLKPLPEETVPSANMTTEETCSSLCDGRSVFVVEAGRNVSVVEAGRSAFFFESAFLFESGFFFEGNERPRAKCSSASTNDNKLSDISDN